MKKLLLLVLCLTQSLSLLAEDWLQQLVNLNADIIDSICYLPQTSTTGEFCAYMIHYHQPLQHDEPELGDLPLRAILAVRQQDDFTQQMMQTWIGGYDLDSTLVDYAVAYAGAFQDSQEGELYGRYGGNLLMPVHRYFGESCPEQPWTTIGYCEAKEAAADFHALIEAVKKIFTGKWVITGGSKGGITTAIQHAFYPDDADLYVAYAAPFLGYSRDTRMQEYWMENSLTPELNKKLLDIQREMLQRTWLLEYYTILMSGSAAAVDYYKTFYLNNIVSFEMDKRSYWTRQQLKDALAYNESVIATYYDNKYLDEMLLYFLLTDKMLLDEEFTKWYNEYIVPLQGGATRVFGISEENWNRDPKISYNYQAMHELGYFDLKWDYYFTEQEDIDEVNQAWQSSFSNVIDASSNGLYAEVVYNPELLDFVRQQTAQAQKPILFIYGGDDAWTGAHMEDEYINGENVQLYILPEQNHLVCINDVTDEELQAKLWTFTDIVFGSSTGISQIGSDHVSPIRTYDLQGRKVSGNGKGLMIRNGSVLFEK